MSENPARVAAAQKRLEMHRAVAAGDETQLRRAMNELYDLEASPLLPSGDVKRAAAFAPIVEAWILASVFDSALRNEMALNVLHTYKSFGLAEEDYERMYDELQLFMDKPTDLATKVWCAETPLEGLVKPARHLKLFVPPSDDA